MAHGLEAIWWDAPWLAPYRTVGASLAHFTDGGASCAEALNVTTPPALMRFVPQAALPAGMAYEQFIFETGQVPTRDGLHDFFNGLVWRHFPRTKRRLNQLQAAQIAADGVGGTRGRVRDAITVFDENAALLHAPDALWDALVARDWARLFGALRPLWDEAQLLLFGHALMEKLVAPRKAITAHLLRVAVRMDDAPGAAGLARLDDWLAHTLDADLLARKPYAPLPVLGVPGWWPANEAPDFYADAQVFRPLRVAA